MNNLNIKQISKKFQISTRTLRYYEQIKLLIPKRNPENSYRIYSYQDQVKLQQILFLKKSGLSLNQITQTFQTGQTQILNSLKQAKQKLEDHITLSQSNLTNLNQTINFLTNNNMNKDLYPDQPNEQSMNLRQEAYARWGSKVEESEQKLSKLSKSERQKLFEQGRQIATQVAENMNQNLEPSSPKTQQNIDLYFQYMQNFYVCTPDIFKGLAEMYISDPRFTKYYEDIAPNLSNYINQAMLHYVQNKK